MSPSAPKTLADIGEAGALKILRRYVAGAGQDVQAGFGDDTAAVRTPASALQLLTADMLVEGVHFLPNPPNWEWVGRKALAVNLSDIAAMGGRPGDALISLGLPPDFRVDDLRALYRGLSREARQGGARLIGGDMVRAPRPTINVALTGWADPDRPLPLRSRCRPGQQLFLTGTVGDSAAGLALLTNPKWKRLRDESWARRLIARHWTPAPRLAAGRALAAALDDLAMIDVSDGVAHECGLLAEASGVAIALDAARLPLSASLRRMARETGEDARASALHGGEDFELLFATRASMENVTRILKRSRIRLSATEIGEVSHGPAKVEIFGAPPSGAKTFEHFTPGKKRDRL